MAKTIAQIAKKQSVSTQAIYKRIKKIQALETGSQPLPNDFKPISNHMSKDESGATVIDDEGQEILFKSVDYEFESESQSVNNHIVDLQKQIEVLTNQLNVKDKQLAKRDQQIETLQTLVSQAHTLAQTAQLTEGKKSIFDWFKRDKKENE